jgi:hypothetical protein
VVISITSVVVVRYTEEESSHGYIFVSRIKAVENIATSKMSFVCRLFNTRGLVMEDNFLVKGWKRFIRAQEYRAHCMAVRQLRTLGYIKEAKEIAEYKHSLYGRFH